MDSTEITVGINQDHDLDWVFDRPFGAQKWLIMCFTTPFRVHTTAGPEIGAAGDCLVVDPGTPQFHGSVSGSAEAFRNDWLYVDDPLMPTRVRELRLPRNTRIVTGQAALIRTYVQAIRREQVDPGPHSEAFLRVQVESILLAIARAGAQRAENTPIGGLHRESLVALRRQVHERLEQPWTVPEMAELVGLRRNRFSALYRHCFGVSPHADLQEARLREASGRLLSGGDSIADVASACGFANAYYFSRAFRQRYGCPPSQFGRGRAAGER